MTLHCGSLVTAVECRLSACPHNEERLAGSHRETDGGATIIGGGGSEGTLLTSDGVPKLCTDGLGVEEELVVGDGVVAVVIEKVDVGLRRLTMTVVETLCQRGIDVGHDGGLLQCVV